VALVHLDRGLDGTASLIDAELSKFTEHAVHARVLSSRSSFTGRRSRGSSSGTPTDLTSCRGASAAASWCCWKTHSQKARRRDMFLRLRCESRWRIESPSDLPVAAAVVWKWSWETPVHGVGFPGYKGIWPCAVGFKV
jgi:hypothetical protein